MKTTKAFRLQEVRQSHTARVYGRDRSIVNSPAKQRPRVATRSPTSPSPISTSGRMGGGSATCNALVLRMSYWKRCSALTSLTCRLCTLVVLWSPGPTHCPIDQAPCAFGGFRNLSLPILINCSCLQKFETLFLRPRPVPKLGQPRHPQAPAYGPWGCRKHRH